MSVLSTWSCAVVSGAACPDAAQSRSKARSHQAGPILSLIHTIPYSQLVAMICHLVKDVLYSAPIIIHGVKPGVQLAGLVTLGESIKIGSQRKVWRLLHLNLYWILWPL